MKRSQAYALTASLCLVAAAGCHGEPETTTPDMASPTDLAAGGEDLTTPPADLTGGDLLPPPPPTEFMVVRINTVAGAANGSSRPTFIEKRQVNSGTLVGTAVALPTAVSGTNKRLTLSTTNVAEGGLSLSDDGRYLIIAGYDADVGTLLVAATMSSTVNRVIGRIDAAGNVNTSTAADFFSTNGIRGAASTNGTDLWAAGQDGIVYTTLGATSVPLSLLGDNMRWLEFIGGQLYGSSGAGSTRGISSIGTGAPKVATTATLLTGFSAQTTTSHYGFVAFDRVAPVGIDTLYVADDRSVANGGGVQRWSLSGTTWTLDGRLAMGLVNNGARGVTGFRTATAVTLLVTTDEVPPRIVKYVDDGTALNQISATELVAGINNTVFRGIALPPK